MSQDKTTLGATRQIKLIFEESNEPSVYATNITVQHTDHEFVISFYEARPPVVLGTPEERAEQLEAIDHVFAPCVARITVTASRMEGFVKALQDNYENYRKTICKEDNANE